jgi:hypothetical protein
MCLLLPPKQRQRGQPIVEYGVLMHNMEEDSHVGTCLMMDGRYATLSWDKLLLAFKRVKEEAYVMTKAQMTLCEELHKAAIVDKPSLELRIAKSEKRYKMGRQAVQDAKPTKKKKPVAPKRATLSEICLGTTVSMFFRWAELGMTGPLLAKCEAKQGVLNSDGEWRTGTVMDIQQNKFRKWLYFCVFDTPTKHKETFASGEIRVGRDNYLKLQAMRELQETSSDDGLSSPVVDTDMLQAHSKTSNLLPTTTTTQAKAKAPTLTIPGTQEDSDGESTYNAALSIVDEDKVAAAAAAQQQGTDAAPEEHSNSETTCEKGMELSMEDKAESDECMAVDEGGTQDNTHSESTANPALSKVHEEKEATGPVSATEGTETTGANCKGIYVNEEGKAVECMAVGHAGAGAGPGTEKMEEDAPAPRETPNVSKSLTEQSASGTEGAEQATAECSISETTVDNTGVDAGLGSEKIEGEDPAPREPPNVAHSATEQSAESMEVHKCDDAGGAGTGVVATEKAPQKLTADDNGATATLVVHGAEELTTAQSSPPKAQGNSTEDDVSDAESLAVDHSGDATEEDIGEEGSINDAVGCVSADTILGAGSMALGNAAEDDRLSLARDIRLELQVTKGILPEAPVGPPDGTFQTSPKRILRRVLREIAKAKKQGNRAEVKRLRKMAAKILHPAKIARTRTTILAKPTKKNRKAPDKEVHTGEDIDGSWNTHDCNVDKKRSRENKIKPDGTQKKKKFKRGATPLPHEDNDHGKEDSEDELGNEDHNYDEEGDEGTEWNNDEWYWDQKFSTWVFTGSKRIRRRDLTNKLERNWILGMRRNWNTAKKNTMVEKITVKRDNMTMVRS